MPGIQIVIDCADPARLVRFWSLVLDYVPSPLPEGFETWNDWYRSVGVPDEQLDLTRDVKLAGGPGGKRVLPGLSHA